MPALIGKWQRLVESSDAHNSELYAGFAERASGAEILAFLRWDARQPPFFEFLRLWLPRAPTVVRPALEAHVREEVEQDHAGLFRRMLDELEQIFPAAKVSLNRSVLDDLNYTFGEKCAAAKSFGFFCGSFFATEIMSAKRCGQLLRGLQRVGVRKPAMEYLSLHAENDALHVEAVKREFLIPLLEGGDAGDEIERGIADRLDRSARFLRWYQEKFPVAGPAK